jgi:hypothetical protein
MAAKQYLAVAAGIPGKSANNQLTGSYRYLIAHTPQMVHTSGAAI